MIRDMFDPAFDEYHEAQVEFLATYRACPHPANQSKEWAALRAATLRVNRAEDALKKLAAEHGRIIRDRFGTRYTATTSGVMFVPKERLIRTARP